MYVMRPPHSAQRTLEMTMERMRARTIKGKALENLGE